MLGACTPRPRLQFLAAWNLHICYAATLLPGLCPRGEPQGQVCRQKTGWWAGLASHAGTRTQASEPDRQGSSAAGTAASLYHGHFGDGFLLRFGSSLYKLIMCNRHCAQKLDAGSREIHKQPWLVLQDLVFAAGSGNSCCLASVSPLPLLGGAASASGTPRSGGSWGQISQRATGIVPASSLGYVQESHIAECSEPPSSSLSSMQGWCWKKREKDQMLWKSWPYYYAACICFVVTLW